MPNWNYASQVPGAVPGMNTLDRRPQQDVPRGLARNTRREMFSTRSCNAAWLLIVIALSGCAPAPGDVSSPPAAASERPATVSAPSPTQSAAASTPESAAAFLSAYQFPASIDPESRYLFYLHGRIIEVQGLPAIDPNYGEYEYQAILKALESHGLRVISEQRSSDTDADAYARRVVGQIAELLSAHVPAGQITVVGASKGAAIAAAVSSMLKDPRVNFVLVGTCPPSMIDEWKSSHRVFYGNVLAIYDSADTEYAGSCEELFRMSEGAGLGRHEEIVLHVGTGHGILYKPLDAWVLPTLDWANK